MTHTCVNNLTVIASDNGLSPGRRQAIIWNNDAILLIWPLGTNFSEILIEIQPFTFKKCIWRCRLENDGHFHSTSMCFTSNGPLFSYIDGVLQSKHLEWSLVNDHIMKDIRSNCNELYFAINYCLYRLNSNLVIAKCIFCNAVEVCNFVYIFLMNYTKIKRK